MNWKILLVALAFATIVLGGLPQKSSGAPEGYRVVMTAYTCEAHPRNPMYPCGPLRWGGNIYTRGIACLDEWRGWDVEVPGFGTYRCDDTIGRPYYNGTPRVDLRVPTLAEALRIGRRYITVYHVDGSQVVATRQAAPTSPLPQLAPTSPPPPPAPTSPPPPPAPTSPPPPPPPTSTPPPPPTSTPAPTSTPLPPTATATPQPLPWTYKDGMSNLIYGLAPNADMQTALISLLRAETVQSYLPLELFEGIEFYQNQPLWLATVWVPASDIPEGTRPKPNSEAEIAAQFFVFDANTGTLLTKSFVSSEILEIMGWIPDDSIDLSHLNR